MARLKVVNFDYAGRPVFKVGNKFIKKFYGLWASVNKNGRIKKSKTNNKENNNG